MSSFAALMALSASQTRQSEAAVQSQLQERQKKEAAKRKAQEEKEAKEREIEKRLRIKHLEDQKREEERRARFEAERRKKEEEAKRKQEEERDLLRYGPKRSSNGYPSSSSAQRRSRMPLSDDEDDSGGGGALTREEKRQLKMQRELNYGMGAGRKAVSGLYKKAGRRLPGGAVDTTAGGSPSSSNTYRSVKERLTHEPPALIKLNTTKRDTRTIDEILQDRAKVKAAKTLSGEDAKGFGNWFGKQKPKADSANEASRASSMFSSRSNSPERRPSQETRPVKSHSATPPVANSKSSKALSTAALSSSVSRLQVSQPPPLKGTGVQVRANGRPVDKSLSTNGSVSKMYPSKKVSASEKVPARPSAREQKPSSKYPLSTTLRKRQRSDSLSDSPPPPKRRTQGAPANSISAEIWKLFGKDRNTYVARDVYSDDEDMEAGADEVEREEKFRCVISRCRVTFVHLIIPLIVA